MSTDLILKEFQNHKIRIQIIDGSPWFVAQDVCNVLEIQNSRDVVAKLDASDVRVDSIYTNKGPRQATVVNESGLYSMVFASRKPSAREFKHWVTSEVLPSIRKTGAYAVEQPVWDIPKTYTEALMLAANLSAKNDALSEENAVLAPKADFHDRLMDTDGTYSVTEAGKILGFSAQELYKVLKSMGLVRQDKLPIDDYRKEGWFTIKAGSYTVAKTGKKVATATTRITVKGLEKIDKAILSREKRIEKKKADGLYQGKLV